MAEAAGLVVGATGLANLATAALDMQEFGRIINNFDEDYSLAFQMMQLTSLRYDRWRLACFPSGENPPPPPPGENPPPSIRNEDKATIEKAILKIQKLFTGLQGLLAAHEDPAVTSAPDDPTGRDRFHKLGIVPRASLRRAGKKFRWATVDIKKVQGDTAAIVTLLDQLDKLMPPSIAKTHQARVKSDALYLQECFHPEELKRATEECDRSVFKCVENSGCAINGIIDMGPINSENDLNMNVGHHVASTDGLTDNSRITMASITTGNGAKVNIGVRVLK